LNDEELIPAIAGATDIERGPTSLENALICARKHGRIGKFDRKASDRLLIESRFEAFRIGLNHGRYGLTRNADIHEGPMSILNSKSTFSALGPLVLLAGLTGAISNAVAAEGPFSDYAGYWSGEGTISVANGANERIRCKATYAVDASGSSLNQTLRCASDSYKLEISSNVVSSGGALSGTWTEATRNATGNIQGRVSGGQISGTIVGVGFTAGLSLSTRGKTQSVTIRPSGSTDIRDVTITMRKS
jgi:hypothetical protein